VWTYSANIYVCQRMQPEPRQALSTNPRLIMPMVLTMTQTFINLPSYQNESYISDSEDEKAVADSTNTRNETDATNNEKTQLTHPKNTISTASEYCLSTEKQSQSSSATTSMKTCTQKKIERAFEAGNREARKEAQVGEEFEKEEEDIEGGKEEEAIEGGNQEESIVSGNQEEAIVSGKGEEEEEGKEEKEEEGGGDDDDEKCVKEEDKEECEEEQVDEEGVEETEGDGEANNRYVPGTYSCANCHMYKRWMYKHKDTRKYKNRYYDKVCVDCGNIVITSQEQKTRKREKRKRQNHNIKSNIQLSNESRKAWTEKSQKTKMDE